jgi:uncharacterized protein (TIGR03437 family)
MGLVLTAGACQAGNITYFVSLTIGEATVNGTIVTDGRMGVLATGDIVSYSLTFSGADQGTVPQNGSFNFTASESAVTATTGQLLFNFNAAGFIYLSDTNNDIPRFVACAPDSTELCDGVGFSDGGENFVAETGTQVIGIAPLTISGGTLPPAMVGAAYSASVQASGGTPPYTYSLSGPMPQVEPRLAPESPPGLQFSAGGVLSGIPTVAGNYNLNIVVTDSAEDFAEGSFTLIVAPTLVLSTASPLPSASVGAPYSTTISASGGTPPYSFAITSGTPPGLSLSSAGVLAGTPAFLGTFNFAVQVTDQFGFTASKSYALTGASPMSPTLTIAGTFPPAIVGGAYSASVQASGGVPPYTYFLSGSSPAGLQFSAGSLSGIPTTAGNYSLNIVVTDAAGNVTAGSFALTVAPPLVLSTASPLPSATAGAPYSAMISASGGTPPYSFAITGSAPPGLGLSSAGALAGTPTSIGSFNFGVQVTDKLGFTASMSYALTVAAGTPLLQVSPSSLSFSAITGGSTPPAQSISVVSTNAAAVSFSVTTDTGVRGSGAPPWISAGGGGATPATIAVAVNPSLLQGSSGSAVIRITVANSATQAEIDVGVSLAVQTAAPVLQVSPGSLQFSAQSDVPAVQQQSITVSNAGGGGAQSFTTTVVGDSPWLNVGASSGQAGSDTATILNVSANPAGLAAGFYHDIIQISGPNMVNVPVSLLVPTSGPILGLGLTGTRFYSRQGSGSAQPLTIPVLDLGDPGSAVNWTATLLSGSDWLTISTPGGTATPTLPGSLVIMPSSGASNLPAGKLYALLSISDPNSQNSPQYFSAIFDNQPVTTPPVPNPVPAGLFFGPETGPQEVILYVSSAVPAAFQASATTANGGPWLAVSPASGVTSTAAPASLTVSITPPSSPGVYTGGINIGLAGTLAIVNVTLVVPTGGSPATSGARPLATAACAASHLVLTETGLAGNFSAPAGYPAALIAQVNDDCANPVTGAFVYASFSNGDPPLPLMPDQGTNTYSADWAPGNVFPGMTITMQATKSPLSPAQIVVGGTATGNSAAQPSLAPGGTLNFFFDAPTAAALGAGLAPGNIVNVNGFNLGPSTAIGASTVPLPTILDGTYLQVGPYTAPLYSVSAGVLAAQIPFELTPGQQYPAVASVNNAISLPIMLTIVPVQPAISVNPDGTAAAEHSNYTPITASNPASAGETITIYLAGMGATDPAVATGAATPPQQVPVIVQPTVTIDSQAATVIYAGLTPGGVGLYQVNLTVPANARSGNLSLVVTQNGVVSNTSMLPVSN